MAAPSGSPRAGARHRLAWLDLAGTRCYRSIDELRSREPVDGIAPLATCSTSLVLYRSTGYSGQALYLSTRGTYISLAAYGFDNDTSSYKIGACAARFYDGGIGSTQYPGNTSAGASASSMGTWNDRVSTVYIT